jgi:hypothetical protein
LALLREVRRYGSASRHRRNSVDQSHDHCHSTPRVQVGIVGGASDPEPAPAQPAEAVAAGDPVENE